MDQNSGFVFLLVMKTIFDRIFFSRELPKAEEQIKNFVLNN